MSNNYDEYMKKLQAVKLDPSRKNLKPVNQSLTFEQHLIQAIKEGNALLDAEAKNSKPKVPSVKSPEPIAQSPEKLQEALAKMSTNPYVRARIQVLSKMQADARSVIEEMEKGNHPKDIRWDMFCKAVTEIGDKLSSKT